MDGTAAAGGNGSGSAQSVASRLVPGQWGLPREERSRERASDWRKLSIPVHMLESICIFGASSISPPALDLCWEHGVAVYVAK
jgi:hypothetical protein